MNIHRMTRKGAPVLAILLSISSGVSAKNDAGAKPAPIHIKNFGHINDKYYRGAQPIGRDYADLAAIGIKTVIDLQADGRYDEKAMVEHAGMKFYRIPLTTSKRPSDTAIAEFLNLVNDATNQPVYVHCAGGRHRTGVMTAVYRMTHDGWTAEQAYEEMKQYHFEGFPPHPNLKNFVYAYHVPVERPHVAETHDDATAAAQ
jgi:protein tyrosine/serine phosphatase